MQHVRRQQPHPSLNQISYFKKQQLRTEGSDPNEAATALNALEAERKELAWKTFCHDMKAEGANFGAWAKGYKVWEADQAQADYEWHSVDQANREGALKQLMAECFPTLLSDDLVGSASAVSVAAKAAADFHESVSVYKVGMLNGIFLGSVLPQLNVDLARHVGRFVNTDPAANAYIILAPNTGNRPMGRTRDSVRAAFRALEAALSDDENKVEVGNITLVFDAASAVSPKSSLRHEGFLVTSAVKDEKFASVSTWAKSALYIRESAEEPCYFLPREDYVNPTAPEVVGAKTVQSGHLQREAKQAVTGPGVYGPLLNALLRGMPLTPKDVVVFVDDCGYDAHMAKAVIKMIHEPRPKQPLPQLAVVTSIWGNTAKDNMKKFIDGQVRAELLQRAKAGLHLKGYTPLKPLTKHAHGPQLDIEVFKLSVPDRSSMVLKIKEEVMAKYLTCPLVGERAKDWLKAFNGEHNPAGALWSPQVSTSFHVCDVVVTVTAY